MNQKIEEHINSFIIFKEKCLRTGYIVRQRRYHEQLASMLKDFIKSTVKLKETTIKQNDEGSANTLLAVECFCESLRSEMLMWIELKKDNPNEAWNYLVDAQDLAKSSARAMPLDRLQQEDYIEKLYQIEVVFPRQYFVSPTFLIKRTECSICNEEYGKCNHIAGKAYMGRFCSEIVTDWGFLDVAFVSYPFDKKRRIIETWQDGKCLDSMTWKRWTNPGEKNPAEGARPSVERK